MNRVVSLTKFYTARFAVKVFFAVLLFSAVNAVSDETGLGQKQFADEISNYQKQRAQSLAQKEVRQNKNIVVAQSQQVARTKRA